MTLFFSEVVPFEILGAAMESVALRFHEVYDIMTGSLGALVQAPATWTWGQVAVCGAWNVATV
jgi:hypothetical protein